MTLAQTDEPAPKKPLRLWPGVVIVTLQWLLRFGVPIVMPEAQIVGIIGEVAGGLAIVVWWLFFSRAPWSDRLGALVLMIVALVATRRIVHPSIENGMMGMMLTLYAIPGLSLALVAGAAAGRRLSNGPRRATMAAAILLACGVWTLVRTNGIIGAGSDFAWRWTKTAEERLLAAGDEPVDLPPAPKAAGFHAGCCSREDSGEASRRSNRQ
jgi:outer membrane protein assembly factor BamB